MVRRLSKKVKELLEKAKESCILAVDIYNKPKTSFRSGAYIVLMTIAWTALFHAIFERDRIKYYYRQKNSIRYVKIDGDRKTWELDKCVKEYFKKPKKEYIPIKENINFFVPLRNKIEHRFMPELDSEIFGECQSLLNNFEFILIEEFGADHNINESLVYSLQFAKARPKVKETTPSKDFSLIKGQIMEYRNRLPDEVFADPRFSFKAALIQVNNPNRADCAIKFINIDNLKPEQKEQLENVIGIIKERVTPVSNLGLFRAGDVAKKVQKELASFYGVKIRFNAAYHHNKCCLEYKVRPKKGSINKIRTKKDFCVYDEAFDDYVYSPKWVEYLIRKLSDKDEFLRLFPHHKKQILGLFSSTETSKIVRRELTQFYGPKIKFSNNHNLTCSRHYGVRPLQGQSKDETDEKYCIYESNSQYLYTQDWIDFLVDKLSSKSEFLMIFPGQRDLIKEES